MSRPKFLEQEYQEPPLPAAPGSRRERARQKAKLLVETKGAGALVLPASGKTRETLLLFDVNEALSILQDETEIALDIETSGLSPWKDRIAVVSLYGKESAVCGVFHVRGKLPEALRAFISEPGRTFTGHNVAAFDALFLSVAGVGIFGPKWFDTLLAELTVIQTGRRDVRVNLQTSVKRRIGVELDKSIDHRTWMQPTLTEEQLAYCAGDVRHLHRLADEQRAEVAGTKRADSLQFEQDLMPTVMRMMLNGLPFSRRAYALYIDRLTSQRDEQSDNLIQTYGPINFRSSKQIKEALAEHGITVASTAHDTLMEISEMGGDSGAIVDVLLDHRMSDQRLKMYSSEWLDKYVVDGWIHPRVWQCAADTGRMTNSEPSLHQVPKDEARRMFEAPDGWSIISADYSQIEVRVAAYYARDQAMLDALAEADLHRAVASQVFGIPAEDITDAQRKLAKAAVFTLLFGGGAGRLYDYARHNGSTIDEQMARNIVRQFFARFQGLSDMRAKAFARANMRKPVFLDLPTGLRRMMVGSSLKGTSILNTLVQGTAAAGLKYGLVEATRRGLDIYLGATVHDENVACVPTPMAQEYTQELKEAMIVGMQRVIPGVEVKVEAEPLETWGGARLHLNPDFKGGKRVKGKEDAYFTPSKHVMESKSYFLSSDSKGAA